MDEETRVNQSQVRREKNAADKRIWDKVPAKVITPDEVGHERMRSPQRIVVSPATEQKIKMPEDDEVRLQREEDECLKIYFTGHDHFKYEVRKGYVGSNFVYITRAPGDALPGSIRTKSITVHIDDLSDLISALREMRDSG